MTHVAKRMGSAANKSAKGAYELGMRVMGRVLEGAALAVEAEEIFGVDFDRSLKAKEYGQFNDAVVDKFQEMRGNELPTVDGTVLTARYIMSADTKKLDKDGRKNVAEAVRFWKKKIQDSQADARRNVTDAYARLPATRERRRAERDAKPPVPWQEIAEEGIEKLSTRLGNVEGGPEFDRIGAAKAAFLKELGIK